MRTLSASILSRRGLAQLGLMLAVCVLGGLALGAKCVENVTVYVDKDGYTHITGELYNQTEIQATAIMLRGRLLDAQGRVIAEKDAPICPPDSQPGGQNTFDIRFDNPNLPPHASYRVNTVAGKVLPQKLPNPNVLVLQTDAIKLTNVIEFPGFPYKNGDVFFLFGLRNRSQTVYKGLQGCAAAYNNAGKVIASVTDEFGYYDDSGQFTPGELGFKNREDFVMYMGGVPESAAYVRGWLWFGEATDTTSAYQFIMTPPITLQTYKLFGGE